MTHLSSYHIPIHRIHRCSDATCSLILKQTGNRFEFVSNSDYDANINRCSGYNRIETYCITIANYDPQEPEMIGPYETVIKDKVIRIAFAYPLSNPFEVVYMNNTGFTRKMLIDKICEIYHDIYEEEAETATSQPEEVKLLSSVTYNREKTNGKYGIWGHHLEDLVIERLMYSPADALVTMHIGS